MLTSLLLKAQCSRFLLYNLHVGLHVLTLNYNPRQNCSHARFKKLAFKRNRIIWKIQFWQNGCVVNIQSKIGSAQFLTEHLWISWFSEQFRNIVTPIMILASHLLEHSALHIIDQWWNVNEILQTHQNGTSCFYSKLQTFLFDKSYLKSSTTPYSSSSPCPSLSAPILNTVCHGNLTVCLPASHFNLHLELILILSAYRFSSCDLASVNKSIPTTQALVTVQFLRYR